MTTTADPNAPAGTVTPAPSGGAAAVATPASDPNDLTARVRAAEDRARIAEQRHRDLSQAYGRQSQEIGELRQRAGRSTTAADPFADPGNGHTTVAPAGVDPVIYEEDRKEMQISGFFRGVALTEERRAQILEIANDAYRAAPFVVRDRFARVDYAGSYQRIADHLELTELRAARAAATGGAPATAGGAPVTSATPRSAGMLSGTSATTPPEQFDIGSASAADVLRKGGLAFDPNDPPSALR